MKIFFITSKLNFKTAGGSVEEFDVMMKTMQSLGADVKAVTAFSSNNVISEKRPYEVIEEQITSNRLIGIQWQLYKILKKYEHVADIFHVDGHLFLYGAGLYRLLGGKIPVSAFFNRELICWPENKSSLFGDNRDNFFVRFKKKLRWYIERYVGAPIADNIDIISFANPILKRGYENFGFRKNRNNLVIGDPIDFKKIMRENGILENSYEKRNKEEGPIILFYSSRMAPAKGFDLAVAAFSKIKNKESFRLILGGTGPEEKLIHQMVNDFGIQKYVEFPGWVSREKLYEFYKKADIFIQPRWRSDQGSISLLYAMAFGLPSILPGGGGLEWFAKKSAVYFKDQDYFDLAKKIEELGKNHELRGALSRNCYARLAEDEINHEKQVDRLYHNMSKSVCAAEL